jgi:hypothetical protein
MNQNPYQSPQASPSAAMGPDERLLRRLIRQFMQWRVKPPTFASLLFSRRSFLLLALVLVGIICVEYSLGMSAEFCSVAIGVICGAAFRDMGLLRRMPWQWKLQEPLMDWDKIEALAREMNI